jgi:hypothetical protein
MNEAEVIRHEAALHRADSLALALDLLFDTNDVNILHGKLRHLQRHMWFCDFDCYGFEVTKKIRQEQRRLLLEELRANSPESSHQEYLDRCLPEVEPEMSPSEIPEMLSVNTPGDIGGVLVGEARLIKP